MTISRGPTSVLGSVQTGAQPLPHHQRANVSAPAVSTAPEQRPCVNNYSERVNTATICFEKQQKQYLESLCPPSLARQASNRNNNGKSHVVSGPQRHALLRKALRSIGLTYSDDQREFTDRMIAACAKLIYKNDLEPNLANLLQELKIDELHQELMAIMPRRYGKTMMVAAFVVALLFSIEGIEIGIFSTGRRASQKILELIYWFLLRLGDMNIIKHNVETIWIQGPHGPSDIRKVSSYPSNVRISPLAYSLFVCSPHRHEWKDVCVMDCAVSKTSKFVCTNEYREHLYATTATAGIRKRGIECAGSNKQARRCFCTWCRRNGNRRKREGDARATPQRCRETQWLLCCQHTGTAERRRGMKKLYDVCTR